MARLLAWDTSDRTGVLCAWELCSGGAPHSSEPKIHFESRLDVDQRQHSEGLFAGIDEALQRAGWSLGSLDAIGIGIGPGSFTGVRIGVTAARTFGQMLGIPLVPVSSLELLADEARHRIPGTGALAVCVDACMGEIYVRTEGGSGGVLEQVVRYADPTRQTWRSALPVDGLWVSSDRRSELAPAGWAHLTLPPLQAGTLAHAVGRRWTAGASATALEVHPAYLRAPDAELKLRQKLAANP
jgi:tRNA threonylcarbamoyl adenosine modification protein YeaZ